MACAEHSKNIRPRQRNLKRLVGRLFHAGPQLQDTVEDVAMNYFAIVHHDADSAYGVTFPDIPGCFAAADEQKDVLQNAIRALDDFLSDKQTVPFAQMLTEIEAEHAADLSEGAYTLLVPYFRRPWQTFAK